IEHDLFFTEIDQRKRIYSCILHFDTPMEMRTSNAPGGARQAKHLIALHNVTDANVNAGQVRIQRIDPKTMIHDHRVSGEKQILCQNHAPPIRGVNRGSGYRMKIRPGMRSSRHTVEHPAMSEIGSCLACDWNYERVLPHHLFRD